MRGFVEVASELREGFESPVLRHVQAQRPHHLFHGFDLRVSAHARNRKADVDRRADAGVEQVRFQIDLPVRNRDDVGRNVGGDVAGLRLDDG